MPKLTSRTELTSGLTLNDLIHLVSGGSSFRCSLETIAQKLSQVDPNYSPTRVAVWTSRSASEANIWNDVIWCPGLALFVAVAQSGANRVMTSPDGINWTARSAAQANGWDGLAWSPQLRLFAAVAWDGTNRVMTSQPIP